jgi:Right handed beta helix region
VGKKHHRQRPGGANRAWPFVIAAAAVFCLLATMPVTLPLIHVQLQPTAAKSSHGVTLLPAPQAPRPVSLPAVAQPIDASQQPAALPAVNAAREAAAVSAEDSRIRIMLHDAAHIYQPEVIPTRGALPTLVLTAGQGSYTAADLVEYGALVMLPNDAALLLDNVFVSTNASLTLGGPALRTLYMDNGSGGFATIVAWDGRLSFFGTSSQPMTIIGWDRAVDAPAADVGNGRSYIREVGGKMTLSDVRASWLGFWSGRTGGVAWTGLSGSPSTGGATSSTFTDNTYGAFVSRGSGVTFHDDLFEFNELDGLHIHRFSVNSSVISSSASRNGGNGFIVSPATQNTLLAGDVSEHNADDGYFINGRPLANGASASGGSVAPGAGTVIENSAALDNGEIGILVEGGTGTVIKGDQVCASVTAIAVRNGVTDAVLTGNDIRCDPRSGFSIGPDTPGMMISGNTVVGPRTGFLISDSGPVELDNNRVTGATVFGVSARGLSSGVTGVGNVISGTGFRAIDARADASMPALSSTDDAGWAYHGRVTAWSYLRFHPLAALWLSIAILLLTAWTWSHRRRLPAHPYPASTRWRGSTRYAPPVNPPPVPAFARAVAGAATDPFPVLREPGPPKRAAFDVFAPASQEVDRQ